VDSRAPASRRMTDTLHIVEPTLVDEAGHCHSFVETLCRAGADPAAFRVWGGRAAVLPRLGALGVPLERRFHRRVRRIQEWALFRRLLRAPGRILVSTGGRTDMLLLDWAAHGRIPPRKAFLYVHWVRPTRRKIAFFRRMAARQPELVILGPTRTVVDVFAEAGFAHRAVVPYPAAPLATAPSPRATFRHVLFAGAAREDKGFSRVVALVELLAARGADLPVLLQTSTDPNDRHDEPTRAALARLAGVRYPHLALRPQTLDAAAYAELFRGAICLQPYDAAAFADRVSGVTLDALSAGAPVVTVPGTWIARVVERFGAGLVADPEPEALLGALLRARAEHDRLADAARAAGRVLRDEHDGRHLLEVLTG
jgi:glycosyltransferase involved in cell wall biosynthesis